MPAFPFCGKRMEKRRNLYDRKNQEKAANEESCRGAFTDFFIFLQEKSENVEKGLIYFLYFGIINCRNK